ncbi:transcription elongation factor S-II [Kwoniella pini CBS 10737]|uniref:Transcription elongation factor n=1 Tax=Kwoniella pini CBS 10737 TaxID=1296096 RepID=A0A1B9HZY9_9TREE|nr:transcription elongation factor S-II [Kwoniella pini CBS 10737]OCF48825.1 transcription elongation factor S-II [Kwoniella pini CBS 10737]
MDAATLTGLVKELNAANADGKTDEVVTILKKLKVEVEPSEDLLRSSKAGVAIGKLRSSTTSSISSLAKEIVKSWRDVIEENKKKRKRDDGDNGNGKKEEGATKRVKAESTSSAPSPAAPSPVASGSANTPEIKNESTLKKSPSPQSPQQRQPLSTIDSTRTTPRTAKTDGVDKSLRADNSDGAHDPVRDKCVVMIYDALAGDSTAQNKILTERAVGIEKHAHKATNYSTGNDYRAKMRSLFLNLKDKGNPALRNEIVLGYISTENVANMSKDEMASESVRALKEKLATENLFKAKAVGETQAETDAFKCGRCQQRKCTYYQMQTRSADEPMTTFVTCTNCGNRWKFS